MLLLSCASFCALLLCFSCSYFFFFFFQAEDGIRDSSVTGVQTCALPICAVVGHDGVGVVAAAVEEDADQRLVVVRLEGGGLAQCGEVQGEGQGGTGGGQLRAAAQECAARVAGGGGGVHGDIALLCRRSVTCSVTCSVTSAPDIRDWPSPAARRLPRG